MRNILLYADDPGGANYLAPLLSALVQAGFRCSFLIAPALADFVLQRGLIASTRPNVSADSLLNGVDLLLVGTSEDRGCFAHQLTDAAKQKNIPSIGVVDMTLNAAGRFQGLSNAPLNHAPDWLAVPDEACRAAYIDLGFPAGKIVVCGHPHYDVVRSRRQLLKEVDRAELRSRIYPDAPPGRPVWLFLAEGVDRLDPSQSYRNADYTLAGRGDTDFRACIVLEELLDAAGSINPRPWIVLRPHPKTALAEFAPVLSELGGIQQNGDPLEAVWAADMVVGMTTMLLLETMLLERPHLSIVPRSLEMEWLPSLKLGLTPFATTREEIRAHLDSAEKGFAASATTLPGDALGKLLGVVSRALNVERCA